MSGPRLESFLRPIRSALLTIARPAVFAVLSWAAVPPVADASAGTADAVLYRVFLQDGSALVSFGEFARVADRVVLSVPIGGTDSNPVLHVLTIAQDDVDWERTNAYTRAARARRYADTRGEAEFAALTRQVADTLHQVGLVQDPAQRLALAESARRQLMTWPQEHHGYRAEELSQMTSWLDQVVSELRVAAGQSSFELAFVARPQMESTPAVQLLPGPDLRQRAELGLVAASRTIDPAERVSLLRAVLDSLQPDAPAGSWMAAVRTRAAAELEAELRVDRAYADLTRQTLERAAPLEKRANVRGLEALVASVLAADKTLDHARPADVAGLLAALDARIDSARRLRLARDAWLMRRNLILAYWRQIRAGLDRFLGVRQWLTDVRQLAGPSPGALRRLAYDAEFAGHELARVKPPVEVASAHSTLGTASRMAARAARLRLEAVRFASMDTAWEASSAAAGALLLLDQAIQELRTITREPAPAAVSR
jgi:hypothetical protein